MSIKTRVKNLFTITKTLPCIRDKGSVTVEAACVVPICLLFLVLFLGLFRVQQVEMQVNQALSYTVTELSVDSGWELLEHLQTRSIFLNELKDQGCKKQYIQDGWQGITLSMAESDEFFVRLKATYHICLPVNMFGKQYVEVTQSAVARRWNGGRGSESQSDQWVYITPFGISYHTTPSCRYLDLTIWAAPKVQITTLRNKEGGKYYACTSCGKSAPDSDTGTVYVTDYGELYHQSLDCGSLKRTIYRVRLEQAEGRSLCQKCGKS